MEAVAKELHPANSCVIKVVEHKKCTTEQALAAVVQRVMQMEAAVSCWEEEEGGGCIVGEGWY